MKEPVNLKSDAKESTKVKFSPEYFNQVELEIIRVLQDNGGRILQTSLVEVTGMSKASISRTITSLEKKGIVVRVRRGVTNEIVLAEIDFN